MTSEEDAKLTTPKTLPLCKLIMRSNSSIDVAQTVQWLREEADFLEKNMNNFSKEYKARLWREGSSRTVARVY